MTKTEIEYEEAPSGYVTFYNYKEPLMKFDEGYGYIGALIFDGKTDKIQCHLCGEWLGNLPHHLKREHNMTASAYKDKVGLFQTTALLSEGARNKLVVAAVARGNQNLKYGKAKTQEQKDKIRKTLIENGKKAEGMNLRGTCPAQLIDRMQKIYAKKGDKILMTDFGGFDELLKATFGSTKEACQIAGIPYNPTGHNKNKVYLKKYTDEMTIDFVKEFVVRFDRTPTCHDFIKQGQQKMYKAVARNIARIQKSYRNNKLYKTRTTGFSKKI